MDSAPAFAHASEAELARILDYYEIAWQYEARAFPIQWNLDGKVVESFSPDFYLPDLDMYVELTTLKQSLVRKKNRKLRRLRELYPEVRIKLLYARDFRALMLKYGRLALLDSLTGSVGQMTPPHADSGPAGGVSPGPNASVVGSSDAGTPRSEAGVTGPSGVGLEPESGALTTTGLSPRQGPASTVSDVRGEPATRPSARASRRRTRSRGVARRPGVRS